MHVKLSDNTGKKRVAMMLNLGILPFFLFLFIILNISNSWLECFICCLVFFIILFILYKVCYSDYDLFLIEENKFIITHANDIKKSGEAKDLLFADVVYINYILSVIYGLFYVKLYGEEYKIRFSRSLFKSSKSLLGSRDDLIVEVKKLLDNASKMLFSSESVGQMKDNDIAGEGNHNTALFWEYDTRTGRRWNVDPLADSFVWQAPYISMDDNPIMKNDPTGAAAKDDNTKSTDQSKSYIPTGPLLLFLSQPTIPKDGSIIKFFYGKAFAVGKHKSTSVASLGTRIVLKKVENKYGEKIAEKVGEKAATLIFKRGGSIVGRRIIPGIGWALTAKDAWDYRREIGIGFKAFSMGAKDYYDLRSDPRTGWMLVK